MKLLLSFLIAVGTFVFAQQASAATYYIDLENGSDAAAGTATTTAWRSLDQFADNTRSAGDVAWVRRGMASTTVYSDIVFNSDGNLHNPITMAADYDNLWGDFANSAQTYTVTFGTTTFASSASTTDINIGDWVYVVGDHTENAGSPTIYGKDFAYEVKNITTTYIEFYLPYKGNITGSGNTLRVMPPNPIWNSTAGDFQFSLASDDYWLIQGLDIRGTDSACVVNLNTQNRADSFKDMIYRTDGVTSCWIAGGAGRTTYNSKSRFYLTSSAGISGGGVYSDSYIDCVSGTTQAFSLAQQRADLILDTTNINNCTSDFVGATSIGGVKVTSRNMINDTRNYNTVSNGAYTQIYYEDYRSSPGQNMTSSNKISSATNIEITRSTTSAASLRTGGATKNLYVTPAAGTTFGGQSTKYFPQSFIKLFEYPIYAASNTPYTYTMYFKQASTSPTSDWTDDPTASELWIEAEYFADPTDADRKVTKSTGVLDFNGTDDWQSLSVSATTTKDGILYLSGWYGKPRETGKANSFYMDIKPVISSP